MIEGGVKIPPSTKQVKMNKTGNVYVMSTPKKGHKHTEESRRKISLSLMGHKVSEETKENIRLSKLGKLCGDENPSKRLEVRKKISKLLMGRKFSEEHKRKIGLSSRGRRTMLGKHLSEESRRKISLAKTGVKMSKEWCRGNALKAMGNKYALGHKQSLEACEKKRLANQERYEDPIERAYTYGLAMKALKHKMHWYHSPIAGNVYLKSSYEIVVAKWLDKSRKEWKYEGLVVPYKDEFGVDRTYYVDFYLPKEGRCIETKGWISKMDELKFQAFRKEYPNLLLEVVTKDKLGAYKIAEEPQREGICPSMS